MKRIICILLAFVTLFGVVFVASPHVNADEMQISQAGVDFIKEWEGFWPQPYWDVNHYTIGYGTTCPDDMVDYYMANPMSKEEAEVHMKNALADFEGSVRSFAASHGLSLTQNQFDALVSFTYNCGAGWTSGGTFADAVKNGKTGSGFVYAMCLWSRAGGEFLLVNRRLAEANIYLNGIYNRNYDPATGPLRSVYLDAGVATVKQPLHAFDINDPMSIIYEFDQPPAGYVFAGWYTEKTGGRKVEVLDSSIPHGSFLYGRWRSSDGTEAYLEMGKEVNIRVKMIHDDVNIRSGPGTHYPDIGDLQIGTELVITRVVYRDNVATWGKFASGWVSLSYTNFDKVLSDMQGYPKVGVVTGSNVNVRSGPGTGNPSVRKAQKGEVVTILEQTSANGYYWGKISDNEWICLDYVDLGASVDPGTGGNPVVADVDGNGTIDKDDAIYLLRHVVYPEKYPISGNCDVNGTGIIDKDDAIYLLRHVVYPDKYPLIS